MKTRSRHEPLVSEPTNRGLRDWFFTPDEVCAQYTLDERAVVAAQVATQALRGTAEQIIREQGSTPTVVASQRRGLRRQKTQSPLVAAGGIVLNQRAVFQYSESVINDGNLDEHNRSMKIRLTRTGETTFPEPIPERYGAVREAAGAIILDSVRDQTAPHPAVPEASAVVIRTGRIFNGKDDPRMGKYPGRYFVPRATFVIPHDANDANVFVTRHWQDLERDPMISFPIAHHEDLVLSDRKLNSLRDAITELTGPDGPYDLISPAGIMLPTYAGRQSQQLGKDERLHQYPLPTEINVEWQLPLAGQLDHLA